jgi:hypothetical protein
MRYRVQYFRTTVRQKYNKKTPSERFDLEHTVEKHGVLLSKREIESDTQGQSAIKMG